MLCFAYGSNMSTQRLAARIPARFVATAKLSAYQLAFHQHSGDGSGKCDIVPASEPSAVFGVVWQVEAHHKPTLDRYEGLGHAYTETWLTVTDLTDSRQLDVQAYIGQITAQGIKPYTWYKHHVLAGAQEHGLPPGYIRALESVQALEDPNTDRHAREIAIHAPELVLER